MSHPTVLTRVHPPELHRRSLALAPVVEEVLATWLAGKDPKTVRAYRADLDAFARQSDADSVEGALRALWALDGPAANAITLRYRGTLIDAGLAPATINRRLSALRSVVKLARLIGRVTWELEVPGVESSTYRDTRGPGIENVRVLARSMDGRQDPKGARDRAVLRLLFEMALRRAEVVELDVEHWNPLAGTLSILGKKRKERELRTVPPGATAALSAWLAARGDAPGPLFFNFDRAGKGGRLTGRSVARILGAAGERAGVGRVRPHGLRHTSITAALDAGADIRTVQKHSRHRDIRTLTLYDDNRTDLAGQVASLVSGLLG